MLRVILTSKINFGLQILHPEFQGNLLRATVFLEQEKLSKYSNHPPFALNKVKISYLFARKRKSNFVVKFLKKFDVFSQFELR